MGFISSSPSMPVTKFSSKFSHQRKRKQKEKRKEKPFFSLYLPSYTTILRSSLPESINWFPRNRFSAQRFPGNRPFPILRNLQWWRRNSSHRPMLRAGTHCKRQWLKATIVWLISRSRRRRRRFFPRKWCWTQPWPEPRNWRSCTMIIRDMVNTVRVNLSWCD